MAREDTVCVTGASGFIGSWVVRLLLEDGYKVHATVQNLEDRNETNHLKGMATELGAKERLKLFQVDLLDYDSFAAAINGCRGVFHLACPNIIEKVDDPKAALVDPAVEGTLNVLKASSAAKAKRVVITSSISSMIPNPSWPAKKPVDEDCWTDLAFCKQKDLWYPISKTLAEKAAWKYSKETGLDVVAINPATVLGPIIPATFNSSIAMLFHLLEGHTDTYDNYWLGCVHVKDVARAQILLYETPSASGRHICVSRMLPFSDFAEMVAKICPQYKVHRFNTRNPNSLHVNNPSKKLNDIGLVFSPIEQAIKESITSLQEKGFLDKLDKTVKSSS